MNFGGGMRLPNNNFGNGNMNNGFNQGRFSSGINSNSFNQTRNVNVPKKPQQTFKSLDGTKWASYDQAMAHNRKIYNGEVVFKSNNFK